MGVYMSKQRIDSEEKQSQAGSCEWLSILSIHPVVGILRV